MTLVGRCVLTESSHGSYVTVAAVGNDFGLWPIGCALPLGAHPGSIGSLVPATAKTDEHMSVRVKVGCENER